MGICKQCAIYLEILYEIKNIIAIHYRRKVHGTTEEKTINIFSENLFC